MAHTDAHTQTHAEARSLLPQRKRLKRGCCRMVAFPDVRAVIRGRTWENGKTCRADSFGVDFRRPAWLWLGGKRSREKPTPCGFQRVEHAPRNRGGAQTCSVMYTRWPPAPKAREKTRGRKRNAWQCAKKVRFIYMYFRGSTSIRVIQRTIVMRATRLKKSPIPCSVVCAASGWCPRHGQLSRGTISFCRVYVLPLKSSYLLEPCARDARSHTATTDTFSAARVDLLYRRLSVPFSSYRWALATSKSGTAIPRRSHRIPSAL